MEENFNMVNKLLIAIIMIKKAEDMHTIPAENARGQKDCRTYEVVLSRLFLCDNKPQQRGDFILNLADTHTCYEQMNHT